MNVLFITSPVSINDKAEGKKFGKQIRNKYKMLKQFEKLYASWITDCTNLKQAICQKRENDNLNFEYDDFC